MAYPVLFLLKFRVISSFPASFMALGGKVQITALVDAAPQAQHRPFGGYSGLPFQAFASELILFKTISGTQSETGASELIFR